MERHRDFLHDNQRGNFHHRELSTPPETDRTFQMSAQLDASHFALDIPWRLSS